MFVAKDHIIIKTCGKTKLLNCVEPLLELTEAYLGITNVQVRSLPILCKFFEFVLTIPHFPFICIMQSPTLNDHSELTFYRPWATRFQGRNLSHLPN